jgi:WD40 repeat protein
LEEDFDVTEGNTFKGHSGPVRDMIKINFFEFVSCDESGQVIVWNKKTNKMKGFSLASIKAKVVEPILSLALTEERGKFLACGTRKGHILLYNRSKGGKRLIENCTKAYSDIVAICNLELLFNKYFLI